MDIAAVLPWLALAVAINTSVTALLAVLVIRSSLSPWPADLGRRAPLGLRVPSRSAPSGARLRAAPGRAVGPGPAAATGEEDPLAGAIAAFLGRSDGLFRAGGPPPGQPTALAGRTRQALAPGARAGGSTPTPTVAAHDRPQSEVTWATSRPSRFVPSGPAVPFERRNDPRSGDPTRDAAPSLESSAADQFDAGVSGPTATASAGRSVSRVSIALSARDGSGAGAGPSVVGRLGPVVGGFIRERTRANDSVTGLTGGRYTVVLPDTPLVGAAALSERLALGCDAWLAAEEPPLRLEFGLVDLPPDAIAGAPVTARASGPERRADPQDS
jgi:hypothetical protein